MLAENPGAFLTCPDEGEQHGVGADPPTARVERGHLTRAAKSF
jgi:hypothetical protein